MTEYQFWVRVLRMAAAVIGATIALWLLGGDRDPAAQSDTFTGRYTVEHNAQLDHDGFTIAGLRGADQGLAACSMDADLALAQWLQTHADASVQLTLRVYDLSMIPKRDSRDGK